MKTQRALDKTLSTLGALSQDELYELSEVIEHLVELLEQIEDGTLKNAPGNPRYLKLFHSSSGKQIYGPYLYLHLNTPQGKIVRYLGKAGKEYSDRLLAQKEATV